MKETMDVLTILETIDLETLFDELKDSEPNGLTDEDYQQGRLMGTVILLLDDLQRTKSLDTSRLRDLAVEIALWG